MRWLPPVRRLFGKAEEQIRQWTRGGYYVTGQQIVENGLAQLPEL
jgi:hypothetical protein